MSDSLTDTVLNLSDSESRTILVVRELVAAWRGTDEAYTAVGIVGMWMGLPEDLRDSTAKLIAAMNTCLVDDGSNKIGGAK